MTLNDAGARLFAGLGIICDPAIEGERDVGDAARLLAGLGIVSVSADPTPEVERDVVDSSVAALQAEILRLRRALEESERKLEASRSQHVRDVDDITKKLAEMTAKYDDLSALHAWCVG